MPLVVAILIPSSERYVTCSEKKTSHTYIYTPNDHKQMRMHAHEALKLQGIPFDKIQPGLTDNALRKLAGNAMTVPILVHIMNRLIPIVV